MLPNDQVTQSVPIVNQQSVIAPPSHKSRNIIITVIIGVFIIAGIAFGATKLSGKNQTLQQNQTEISGNFDLNGIIPKNSTITLAVRKMGEKQFTDVLTNITPLDLGVWKWHQAEKGQKYDIQAYLELDGKIIEKSDILAITAPAFNNSLRINSHQQPLFANKTNISGTFDLSGTVPGGSIVTIKTFTDGEFPEQDIDVPARNKGSWSFDFALKGKNYRVIGYLKNNDEIIGQSDEFTVTAPADHEIIKIKSFVGSDNSPSSATQSGTGI